MSELAPVTLIKMQSNIIKHCQKETPNHFKENKGAKIRNRYSQVPHLTQDSNGKVLNSLLYTTNKIQEVSSFPTGDHNAQTNRRAQRHNNYKTEKKDPQKKHRPRSVSKYFTERLNHIHGANLALNSDVDQDTFGNTSDIDITVLQIAFDEVFLKIISIIISCQLILYGQLTLRFEMF